MKPILFMKLFFLSILFIGCSDSDDTEPGMLSGTYVGTISGIDHAKSREIKTADQFTAKVKRHGDPLQVHCSGPGIHVEFMLEYYQHKDDYMVCLAGDDYRNPR